MTKNLARYETFCSFVSTSARMKKRFLYIMAVLLLVLGVSCSKHELLEKTPAVPHNTEEVEATASGSDGSEITDPNHRNDKEDPDGKGVIDPTGGTITDPNHGGGGGTITDPNHDGGGKPNTKLENKKKNRG